MLRCWILISILIINCWACRSRILMIYLILLIKILLKRQKKKESNGTWKESEHKDGSLITTSRCHNKRTMAKTVLYHLQNPMEFHHHEPSQIRERQLQFLILKLGALIKKIQIHQISKTRTIQIQKISTISKTRSRYQIQINQIRPEG